MLRKIVPDVVADQDLARLPRGATVRQATELMAARDIGAVLVIGPDDRLEGIFTERDALKRVLAAGRDPDRTPLSSVMTADPETIAPDRTAIEALRMMREGNYRHLPVCDGSHLVGIVSQRDFFGIELTRIEDEEYLWRRL